jgi:glutamate 5-kinase
MIISAGNRLNPLSAIDRGERSTFFRPSPNPVRGYKSWIAGQLEPAGRLHVDAGAVEALLQGKSLLAAGVKRVAGNFSRGDTVAILDASGREIARGLVAYDAGDAVKIAGLKSAEIAPVLGYAARSAMVHRDDLVVGRTAEPATGTGG